MRYGRPRLVHPPCICQQTSMFGNPRTIDVSFSVPAEHCQQQGRWQPAAASSSDPSAGWVLHVVQADGEEAQPLTAAHVSCSSCLPVGGAAVTLLGSDDDGWSPVEEQLETLLTFRVNLTATEPGIMQFLLNKAHEPWPAMREQSGSGRGAWDMCDADAYAAGGMSNSTSISAPLLVLPSAAAVAEVGKLFSDMMEQQAAEDADSDAGEADAAAVISSAFCSSDKEGEMWASSVGSSSFGGQLGAQLGGKGMGGDRQQGQSQLLESVAWSQHLRPLLHDLQLLLAGTHNSSSSADADQPTGTAAPTGKAATAAAAAAAAAAAVAQPAASPAPLGSPSWLVQHASAAMYSVCGATTAPLLPAPAPAPQPPAVAPRLEAEQQLQVSLLEGLLQFFATNGMWCCISFLLASCLRNGLVAPAGEGAAACLGLSQVQRALQVGTCKRAACGGCQACSDSVASEDEEDDNVAACEEEWEAAEGRAVGGKRHWQAGNKGTGPTAKRRGLQEGGLYQQKANSGASNRGGSLSSRLGQVEGQAVGSASSAVAPAAGVACRAAVLLVVMVLVAQLVFVVGTLGDAVCCA